MKSPEREEEEAEAYCTAAAAGGGGLLPRVQLCSKGEMTFSKKDSQRCCFDGGHINMH